MKRFERFEEDEERPEVKRESEDGNGNEWDEPASSEVAQVTFRGTFVAGATFGLPSVYG